MKNGNGAEDPGRKEPDVEYAGIFEGNVASCNAGDGFVFSGPIPPGVLIRGNQAHGNGGAGFRFLPDPVPILESHGIPLSIPPRLLGQILVAMEDAKVRALPEQEREGGIAKVLKGIGSGLDKIVGFAANLSTLSSDSRFQDLMMAVLSRC